MIQFVHFQTSTIFVLDLLRYPIKVGTCFQLSQGQTSTIFVPKVSALTWTEESADEKL